MAKRKKQQRTMMRAQHQIARLTTALTEAQKEAILTKFRGLKGPARSFVSEIFNQAKKARGRLDEDVYGVLQATMEALKYTGGIPPPLVFGVSHYETAKIEQVGFMPNGVTELPPGGKFITNHPALNPGNIDGPHQLRG